MEQGVFSFDEESDGGGDQAVLIDRHLELREESAELFPGQAVFLPQRLERCQVLHGSPPRADRGGIHGRTVIRSCVAGQG